MTHLEPDKALEIICGLLGLVLFQARVIWKLVRERNCSRRLLVLEQQSHISVRRDEQKRHIEQHNETLRVVLTAFASAEPVTLDDLLQQAERDWSLKSSDTPSPEE